ncbi:MAG: 30S ribosomal protein S14, partial [Enterococcus thailandicus]|nr:30S ribosomal protein S14 [Enterococcus thailandicus]
MAKKAKIARARKQQELIEQYAEIRLQLKTANDYEGLAKLPK